VAIVAKNLQLQDGTTIAINANAWKTRLEANQPLNHPWTNVKTKMTLGGAMDIAMTS